MVYVCLLSVVQGILFHVAAEREATDSPHIVVEGLVLQSDAGLASTTLATGAKRTRRGNRGDRFSTFQQMTDSTHLSFVSGVCRATVPNEAGLPGVTSFCAKRPVSRRGLAVLSPRAERRDHVAGDFVTCMLLGELDDKRGDSESPDMQ